ncbi:MAG: tautomerase family protein [Gemmatimonadota bacterium]|nr:tautomerase family protein [Gemmatimonadota bacterium]
MPLIRATLVEKAITPAQRQELISRITDAVVSVYGETMRPYTWVLIDEITSGQSGVAGHGFTTEEVRATMAGEPALQTS